MPAVRIKRKPLWKVELLVGLKDGTEITNQIQARFDPSEARDDVEDGPIEEALEQLFDDPRLEALAENDDLVGQLKEFNLRVRRIS